MIKIKSHKLSEICDIQIGRTPKRKNKKYWGEGHTWVTISDLSEDKYISETKEEITDIAVEECGCKLIPKGTVIFSFKLSIGKRAIAGKDLYTNEAIAAFIIKDKERVDAEFLYYVLDTVKIVGMNNAAMGKTLNTKSLRNIRVPIPEKINDQKRIVSILKKTESLVKQRKESIDLADQFLEMKFLKIFDKLFQKPHQELGEHLKIQQGYAYKSKDFVEEGIPVIKIGTINKGYFELDNFSFLPDKFLESAQRYIIYPGDLLISMTGTVGKDDYANTCFVTNDFEKYLLNQRVGKLIPDENKLNKYFLHYLFQLPRIKSQLIKANRGVRQANLSNNDILNLSINRPPIDHQNKFASIVEQVEKLKRHYYESLNELNNLYGSLSQRAFKGELDLSNVDVEEKESKVPEEKSFYGTIEKAFEEEERKDLDQFIDKEFIDKGYEGDTALFLSQALKAELKKIDEAPVNAPEYHLLMLVIETLRERDESFSFEQFWDIIHSELEEDVDYEDIKRVLFTWLQGEEPLLTQQFSEVEKRIKFLFNEAS